MGPGYTRAYRWQAARRARHLRRAGAPRFEIFELRADRLRLRRLGKGNEGIIFQAGARRAGTPEARLDWRNESLYEAGGLRTCLRPFVEARAHQVRDASSHLAANVYHLHRSRREASFFVSKIFGKRDSQSFRL